MIINDVVVCSPWERTTRHPTEEERESRGGGTLLIYLAIP